MKTGLVLEGGAMRGIFSAGVMDVLMENQIEFDGIIGISAGACFGCNYKSRQPGRALRYNVSYCRDKRYCSLHSLLSTGNLFGAEFCYHEIPEKLDIFDFETYDQSPVEFYLAATDVETGQPVYHRCDRADDEMMTWLMASAAMPLFARIVEVGGKKLLDGGISDSIPLKYFQKIGYEKNVVILTQPADYVKTKNRLLPVLRIVLRRYPRFLQALEQRHLLYNLTTEYIRQQEASGSTFVIQPPEKLPIGHVEHDPDVLRAVYAIGRQTAEARLDALRKFLRSSAIPAQNSPDF